MITDCPLIIVIYHISHITDYERNIHSLRIFRRSYRRRRSSSASRTRKGEDTRKRIREILRKKGIICCDSEIDALVEQLTSEVEAE